MSMSLKDFVAIRKNAAHFGFFEEQKVDINKPDESLVEKFGENAFFDHAFYDFEDSSLSAILLFAERIDAESHYRDLFVKQVLELYGEPDEIVVVQQPVKNAYNAPGLIWHRKSVIIMVDFTLDPPQTRNSLYQFKAFDTNVRQTKPLYIVPVLSETERAKIVSSSKSLIKRLGTTEKKPKE